jgi:plasmid stabilization system protein ParE
MTYQLTVRPEVISDISEAIDWYERQQPGLGEQLTDELRKCIRSLRINPLLYRIRHTRNRVRWVLIRRFPYRVVFVVEGSAITILAVTHAKRHDRHWKGRV